MPKPHGGRIWPHNVKAKGELAAKLPGSEGAGWGHTFFWVLFAAEPMLAPRVSAPLLSQPSQTLFTFSNDVLLHFFQAKPPP